jgi:hypothetical protein
MKFVIGPDQVNFSYLICFVDIPGKGIVPVRRILRFKLRWKSPYFHSSEAFRIPNCCKSRRKSADFHSSDACSIPNCCKSRKKSDNFHSSDACCIPNVRKRP